jgi:hypothetical protein
MPKLTVQNAEIKTAAVEVRTLTLSGKQVTLSVFKQIEQAPIIQEDGMLAGEPWGRINYHPDKCADFELHHHVVWQVGSELRRAAHARPAFRIFWSQTAEDFMTAAVFEFLQGNVSLFDAGKPPAREQYGQVQSIGSQVVVGSVTVELEASELAVEAYAAWRNAQKEDTPSGRAATRQWSAPAQASKGNDWPEPARPSDGPSRFDQATEKLAAAMAKLRAEVAEFDGSAVELQARLNKEIQDEADRRSRHRQSWQILCELPQLFIAV